VLGEAAYGVVCLAKDSKNPKQKVAIKKCAFSNKFRAMALRTLREMHILRYLDHPNLLCLRDLMPPLARSNFDCVYIVLDSMDTNLSRIIRSKQALENIDIQILTYQMLKGLLYFHQCGLIHRDIKPSNILVNADLFLKICDFGLSRGMAEGVDADMTEYVVTRHYRAPEVMTNPTKYDVKIDVWGIGCILAELIGREVLFPGQDYLSQLQLILKTLGTPSAEDLEHVHPKARRYIEELGKFPRKPWREKYPHADPLALDLLDQMLAFNPAKRISVEAALKHSWFESMKKHPYYHELKTLSVEKRPAAHIDFSWEKPDMSKEELIELLCQEILVYRPELKEKLAAGPVKAKDDEDEVVGASPPSGAPAAAPAAAPDAAAPAAAAAPAEAHADGDAGKKGILGSLFGRKK
jgi:mitogen-activated protein kinase 6